MKKTAVSVMKMRSALELVFTDKKFVYNTNPLLVWNNLLRLSCCVFSAESVLT
jgi:hypothetical protein